LLERGRLVSARPSRKPWKALLLNLPFHSYSIPGLSSPPDWFSSRVFAFLQACFSHRLMENCLPDLCSFNTAGICRIGYPERITSYTEARETDRTSQPTFAFGTENP